VNALFWCARLQKSPVKQNGVGGGGSRNAKSGSNWWVGVDRDASNQGVAPRSSRKITAICRFVAAQGTFVRRSNCKGGRRETRSSAVGVDHFEQIVVTSSGFFDLLHGKTRGGSRYRPRMAPGFRVLRGASGPRLVIPVRAVLLCYCVTVLLCCYSYKNTCYYIAV
jgi:hypothetical protein